MPNTPKQSIEVVNAAAEIKLRAERKAGEYLKGMEKAKGGTPAVVADDHRISISEIGISKDNSSQWQRIAEPLKGINIVRQIRLVVHRSTVPNDKDAST